MKVKVGVETLFWIANSNINNKVEVLWIFNAIDKWDSTNLLTR